jgi:TadE-like protein
MKRVAFHLRRLARCESGTATIEAIIALPLAISLMAGGVEFGRIISAHSTADKSLHSAARYLARVPTGAVCSWGFTNAQNLAVYGRINPGTPPTPLIPSYGTGNITLTSPNCPITVPDPIVIELRAAVPFTVTMLSAIGFSNSFTLRVRHQERHIGE